jgi:hypothetical protein
MLPWTNLFKNFAPITSIWRQKARVVLANLLF